MAERKAKTLRYFETKPEAEGYVESMRSKGYDFWLEHHEDNAPFPWAGVSHLWMFAPGSSK